MLETLTRGFRAGRDRLRGEAELSEENVAEALRDVRTSLLEADVDLGIVRSFLAQVQERCLGTTVALRGGKGDKRMRVSAGDHFTKACYDELVALMGEPAPLEPARKRRVILLLGLQGTGKTSTAAKLARYLKDQGERPLLVAADIYRPAAREQLRVLGEQIGVEVFTLEQPDAAAIADAAIAHAAEHGHHSVIIDTAGRLQIDEELMEELQTIHQRSQPEHSLLVCDSMVGREAVHVAEAFAAKLPIDGLILSKLDGDARGGAALAIRRATGVPIRYVTTGEGTDRLETFRPEGLASRILGMGDVRSLIESFEKVVDEEKAEADAKRMLRGKFSLEDFLSQLRAIQKMGSLRELLEKLPFAGDLFPEGFELQGNEMQRIEAMILSMTPLERQQPDVIDASRRRRIARGSGTQERELLDMLERFGAMRKMMGQLGKASGMLGKVPGLSRLMGGGGGGMPDLGMGMPGGLDPSQLGALGIGAPNRAVARAQKADAKRKARKQKRKHQRRGKRR